MISRTGFVDSMALLHVPMQMRSPRKTQKVANAVCADKKISASMLHVQSKESSEEKESFF